MLISIEKRFFFIANTKTASTSIEHVLLPYTDIFRGGTPERKHIQMRQAIRSYPFLFNQKPFQPGDFFRFGVMREPMDWIASWFRYRKGNRTAVPLPDDMDFRAFWKQADWNVRLRNGSPTLQSTMFCNPRGVSLVDYIIPYHQLDDVFADICKELKLPVSLPKMNVSALQESAVIPEDMKAELRDHYAEDYALWDSLPEINAKGMKRLRARIAPTVSKDMRPR